MAFTEQCQAEDSAPTYCSTVVSGDAYPQCIDEKNMWYKVKEGGGESLIFRVLSKDNFSTKETNLDCQKPSPVNPFSFVDELKEMIKTSISSTGKILSCEGIKSASFYRTASWVYNEIDVQVLWIDDADNGMRAGKLDNASTGVKSAHEELEDNDMILEDEWPVLMLITTLKRWDAIDCILRFHSMYATYFLLQHNRNMKIKSDGVRQTTSDSSNSSGRPTTWKETQTQWKYPAMVLLSPHFEISSKTSPTERKPLLVLLPSSSSVDTTVQQDIPDDDANITTKPIHISSRAVLSALKAIFTYLTPEWKLNTRNADEDEKGMPPTNLVDAIQQYFRNTPDQGSFLVIGVEVMLEILQDGRWPQHRWNQLVQAVFSGRLLPVCETVSPNCVSSGASSDTMPLFLPIAPQEIQKNCRLSMCLCARIQESVHPTPNINNNTALDYKTQPVSTSDVKEASIHLRGSPHSSSSSCANNEEDVSRDWFSSLTLEPCFTGFDLASPYGTKGSSDSIRCERNLKWMVENCFSFGAANLHSSSRPFLHLAEVLMLSALFSSESSQIKKKGEDFFFFPFRNCGSFFENSLFACFPFIVLPHSNTSITGKDRDTKEDVLHAATGRGFNSSEEPSAPMSLKHYDPVGCKTSLRHSLWSLFSMAQTLILSAALGVGEALHFCHSPIPLSDVMLNLHTSPSLRQTSAAAGEWITLVQERIHALLEWMSNATVSSFFLSTHCVHEEKDLFLPYHPKESEETVTSSAWSSSPSSDRQLMAGFYRFLAKVAETQTECFTDLWLGAMPWGTTNACCKFDHRAQLFYFGVIENVLKAVEEGSERMKLSGRYPEGNRIEEESEAGQPWNVPELWQALCNWVKYWRDFLGMVLHENEKYLTSSPSVPTSAPHYLDNETVGVEGSYHEEQVATSKKDSSDAWPEKACDPPSPVTRNQEKLTDEWAFEGAEYDENDGWGEKDCHRTSPELIQSVLQSLVMRIDERLEYGKIPLPALYEIIRLEKPSSKNGGDNGSENGTKDSCNHQIRELIIPTVTPLPESFEKAKLGFAKRADQESDTTKLLFYGLYKQATTGNINIPMPWVLDRVGRAKWNAWDQLKGLTREEAMERYVDEYRKILEGKI